MPKITTNLYQVGLESRIESFIALTGFYVSLPKVHRVLHINWHYNKNFMFPEFQELPQTFFDFESKRCPKFALKFQYDFSFL